MSIRIKVMLIGLILLLLLPTLLTISTIYQLKQQEKHNLAAYHEASLEKMHEKLKALVNLAHHKIETSHKNSNAFIQKQYGQQLNNIIDIAESILQHQQSLVEHGEISLAQAQKNAKAAIRQIRYDDGAGYIWIFDTTHPFPRMLMHPTNPALEGKILNDTAYDNIAFNKTTNLLKAFLHICDTRGEGFVDYFWPKPTPEGKLTPDVPKLSYIRLFKKWGWGLGTGVYVDSAKDSLLDAIKIDLSQTRYDDIGGYFWINDMAEPFPHIVMHSALPELRNKVMQYGLFENSAHGKNLGHAIVQAVADTGEGLVEYTWPKVTPNGTIPDQPKLAYVKLYKPLNWIVGTGVYLDELDKEIAEKEEQLKYQLNTLIVNELVFSGILFILVSVFLFWLTDWFLRPLVQVNRQLQQLANGKLPEKNIRYPSKDEIGEIIRSFWLLRQKVADVIQRTRAIATGDFSNANRDAVKQDDALEHALSDMTTALSLAVDKNATQDWLKTGQTKLYEVMRGEQSEVDLAENILTLLCSYLDAKTALFYFATPEGDALSLYASHHFEQRQYLANQLRLGEALPGQAAIEKKRILLSEPDLTVTLLENQYVMAVPFFYEQTLKGVIELGFETYPKTIYLEFLDLVMQDIGIAVNSSQSRVQLEKLLHRGQE